MPIESPSPTWVKGQVNKPWQPSALPIVKFMDLLNALQMPVVEYGEDEYAQDIKTIAALTGASEDSR